MKPNLSAFLSTVLLAVSLTLSSLAAEKGQHEHPKIGPTNGRMITSVEPHIEFLITKNRTIELRFVDDANKIVAPGQQEITVTLGERANPTKLTFTKEGDKLISSGPIPAGNDHPTVVQIRAKAGAKPLNEKFNLDLTRCPSCENAEYNCKCDHGEEKRK